MDEAAPLLVPCLDVTEAETPVDGEGGLVSLDDGRYICVQKFLTPKHVIAHLKGALTLGAYALNTDHRARFLAFDADDGPQWSQLIQMSVSLETKGCTAYLEASRRGGHLWLFFSMQTKGKVARELGKGLSLVYGLEGIELFPKQDRLTGGPGSLVRLPFGVHRKTGQRYGFISPDGQLLAPTMDEQVRILAQPKTVPPSFFRRIVRSSP